MSAVDLLYFFFFNDTATTEIYTLSLHDALPISRIAAATAMAPVPRSDAAAAPAVAPARGRSEEHTSELQSLTNLVCRLLLEKKKKKNNQNQHNKHTKRNQRHSRHHTRQAHVATV